MSKYSTRAARNRLRYTLSLLRGKSAGIYLSGKQALERLEEERADNAEGQIPMQLLHPCSEPIGHLTAPAFDAELNFD